MTQFDSSDGAIIGNDDQSNLILQASNASNPNMVLGKNGSVTIPNGNLYLPNGRVSVSSQAHFLAYLSENLATGTVPHKSSITVNLIADTVISNIGDHYNQTTGKFTAPVDGVYRFDCHIRGLFYRIGGEATILMKIGDLFHKNTQTIHRIRSGISSEDSLVLGLTSYMKAGSKAYCGIEMYNDADAGYLPYAYLVGVPDQSISRFSGALLA